MAQDDTSDSWAQFEALLQDDRSIDHRDVPHSEDQTLMAQLYTKSQQTIPQYYVSAVCKVDNLNAKRGEVNKASDSDGGVKLSVNDYVIKASALACKEVPEVNSSWRKGFIREYSDVNIGFVVQTAAGPVLPMIKQADAKGLVAISAEAKALAAAAIEGRIEFTEFGVPTFVISSLARFGIRDFVSMVAPVLPQAATLAVGAIYKQVVAAGDGFSEASFLNVTLTCDHRVVDGAVGAMWLQAFRRCLEDPSTLPH